MMVLVPAIILRIGWVALALGCVLLGSCSGRTRVPDKELSKEPRSNYPFVLHHGFLAGRNMQWPGAQRYLISRGYVVYKTEVSASLPIEDRAKQLKVEIDEILKATEAERVNVIAHSMGGLDARFLISSLGYEGKIASLTTLSTPHRGTPVADQMLTETSETERQILGAVLDLIARFVNPKTTFSKSDAMSAVRCLSESYLENDFNPKNPNRQRVYYQSWGAEMPKATRSNLAYEQLVKSYDTLFAIRGQNDGLVPVSSAAWGVFRGVLPSDHMALAGQRFGGGAPNRFDYRGFLDGVMDELSQRQL